MCSPGERSLWHCKTNVAQAGQLDYLDQLDYLLSSILFIKQQEASNSVVNARYCFTCDKTIASCINTERNLVHFSLKMYCGNLQSHLSDIWATVRQTSLSHLSTGCKDVVKNFHFSLRLLEESDIHILHFYEEWAAFDKGQPCPPDPPSNSMCFPRICKCRIQNLEYVNDCGNYLAEPFMYMHRVIQYINIYCPSSANTKQNPNIIIHPVCTSSNPVAVI